MFKASQMEEFDPGNTIPDPQPSASQTPVEYITGMFTKRTPPDQIDDKLAHLPQFEAIKAKIQTQQARLNDVKADQLRLEAAIDKERQKLADDKQEIENKLKALEDHIVEHMSSIYSLPYLKKLIDEALEREPAEPPTETDIGRPAMMMEPIDDA